MSLLVDTDVSVTLMATQSASVTLLLGLQQLTSLPPELANKNDNHSGSSALTAFNLANDTQVASMSLGSRNLTTSSVHSGAEHMPKRGILLAVYMACAVVFASVL